MDDLKAAMTQIAKVPTSFATLEPVSRKSYSACCRINPQMVIAPSNSLNIEALHGTHPLLEDFKLIHRAENAQAEARKAELENLRFSARLANADTAIQIWQRKS